MSGIANEGDIKYSIVLCSFSGYKVSYVSDIGYNSNAYKCYILDSINYDIRTYTQYGSAQAKGSGLTKTKVNNANTYSSINFDPKIWDYTDLSYSNNKLIDLR